jgi:hypothetical protein
MFGAKGDIDMQKKNLVITLLAVSLAFVAMAGFAQDKLAVGTAAPVVDGVVASGEYALQKDYGQMQISLSRTADTLFVAAVAATKGWIAVGLGSPRMDGSAIFMGFVGEDGKVQFASQTGAGHRHSDAAKAVADSVVSYSIKESGGKTTLEVALKAAGYVKAGQSALDLIYAIGPQKSFSPYHTFRGVAKIALAQ